MLDDAEREQIAIQQLESISTLRYKFIKELGYSLDNDGGVRDAAAATAVAGLAVSAVYWTQRTALCKALIATQAPSALSAFLGMHQLVAVLNNWIYMADEDAQWTWIPEQKHRAH